MFKVANNYFIVCFITAETVECRKILFIIMFYNNNNNSIRLKLHDVPKIHGFFILC